MSTLKKASQARSAFEGTVLSVMGSVGKTTTSHVLAQLLAMVDKTYRATAGNYPRGIFKDLCRLPTDAAHAVFEVSGAAIINGTDRPVAEYVHRVLKPGVCLFTMMASSHIGRTGTIEGMAMRKAAGFSEIKSGGVLIINRDTKHYDTLLAYVPKEVRVVTYGKNPVSDFLMVGISHQGFSFMYRGEKFVVGTSFVPFEMQVNFLGAIATVACLYPEKWKDTLGYFKAHKPLLGRGRRYLGIKFNDLAIHVIDESYNANPKAVRSVLTAFRNRKVPGRKVVVLGEMMELGEYAAIAHRELVEALPKLGFDVVVLVGEVFNTFRGEGSPFVFTPLADLTDTLKTHLWAGDTVLFKGSNATGLYAYVKRLVKP